MQQRPTRIPAAALLVILPLAGCSPDYSPNTYAAAAVQQANKVEPGVVVGVRAVDISADPTLGAATGAAAGGIAGSQSAGGVGSAFGALGGALVGGAIGSAAQHTSADTMAWEYIVRQPKGDLLSVTQRDTKPLTVGQKVLVIDGKQARIVPDYTVPVPADAAKAATPPTGDAAAGVTSTVPPAAPIHATSLAPPGQGAPTQPAQSGATNTPLVLASPAPPPPVTPSVALPVVPATTPVAVAAPGVAAAASPNAGSTPAINAGPTPLAPPPPAPAAPPRAARASP